MLSFTWSNPSSHVCICDVTTQPETNGACEFDVCREGGSSASHGCAAYAHSSVRGVRTCTPYFIRITHCSGLSRKAADGDEVFSAPSWTCALPESAPHHLYPLTFPWLPYSAAVPNLGCNTLMSPTSYCANANNTEQPGIQRTLMKRKSCPINYVCGTQRI